VLIVSKAVGTGLAGRGEFAYVIAIEVVNGLINEKATSDSSVSSHISLFLSTILIPWRLPSPPLPPSPAASMKWVMNE
jgi:hypothetical protein